MIMKLMHYIFIFLMALISLGHGKGVSVDQLYLQTDLYQDGVTYNIVSFTYNEEIASPDIYIEETTEESLKIGITTSDNVLIDLIWEYQSLTGDPIHNVIQSIELNDLNRDKQKDIIINYTDNESEFPDQIISSFLLNNQNKFQEISETFVKNRYTILDNSHIKYETPLAIFGRPYVDEDAPKESNYWVDYYEFQGLKLVNINQKYRDFYETFKVNSSKRLETTLDKIKQFNMTDELTVNQLQLEEYFNEITELKTIIYRSNQILY
jgi:hypothetical protein